MTEYTPTPAVAELAAKIAERAERIARVAGEMTVHDHEVITPTFEMAGLTPEQEIRIEALDSAVRYWAVESHKVTPGAVLTVAERFAAYITDGTVEESP